MSRIHIPDKMKFNQYNVHCNLPDSPKKRLNLHKRNACQDVFFSHPDQSAPTPQNPEKRDKKHLDEAI